MAELTMEAEFGDRLDQKVESDSLARIAESILDWPGVANVLPGIKDQDVAAIKDKQPPGLHKITLLKIWEVRNGHLATYHQLAKSLRDASANNSVETLCHELRAQTAQPIQHTSARAILEEAGRLQDNFVTVVVDMKISFMEKEAESTTFLMKLKTLLTSLPLYKKHKHLHFLEEEKERIDMGKNVKEILDILDPYWNYREYAFLERIIKKFGTSELKEEMKDYISELEEFEKKTSVKDYNSAAQDKIEIPTHFKELAITQLKDPAQCSLYDVRQLINDIVNRSTLAEYAVFVKSLSPSSVKIVLAFPPEAYEELLRVLDERFMKIHKLAWAKEWPLPCASRSITHRLSAEQIQPSGTPESHVYTPPEFKRFGKPELRKLINIGVRFQDKWEDIGTELKVENFRLRAIKIDNPLNAQACMRKVFTEWENGMTSPYTWENLAEVLCSPAINEKKVLEDMYKECLKQE